MSGEKMTARDILMSLRRLFTAGQWCRGSFHITHHGKHYFCLVGGLNHVTRYANNTNSYQQARRALRLAAGQELTSFNDRQADVGPVIDVIDQAIKRVSSNDG
jgi:hypothetical protein